MKKKSLEELKNKSNNQLKDMIAVMEKEMITDRIEREQSKTKNVHAINRKRKDIAQIKTIMHQKLFLEKKENQNAAS